MINSRLDASKQQLSKNQVVILDKAQIAIDTLPKQEQENTINIINCLEYFPDCAEIEYKT
jgi:hypothetical protein